MAHRPRCSSRSEMFQSGFRIDQCSCRRLMIFQLFLPEQPVKMQQGEACPSSSTQEWLPSAVDAGRPRRWEQLQNVLVSLEEELRMLDQRHDHLLRQVNLWMLPRGCKTMSAVSSAQNNGCAVLCPCSSTKTVCSAELRQVVTPGLKSLPRPLKRLVEAPTIRLACSG